jgi:hypothetical protein
MRWKLLFWMMMELVGSSWWLKKAQKSTRQHKKLQAEKVRKDALADVSNPHHAWSYKKLVVKSLATACGGEVPFP